MFDKAIGILNDTYPYWTTRVLNIGYPVLSSSIETACIAWDKDGDFSFMFNPKFAESLDDAGRAFIMSHEAMHVVRNDMRFMADPSYEDKKRLNIALDCIVNDTLRNAGMETLPEAWHGDRAEIGDCEGRPVREVYDLLKKDDEGKADGDADSDGDSDDSDDTREPKPHDDHSGWNEKMADAAEEHSKSGDDDAGTKAIENDEEGNPTGGYDPTHGSVHATDIVRMNFPKLFGMMDPDMVDSYGFTYATRADWRKPRRSLAGLHGKVMLPSKRDNRDEMTMGSKKPQILVAIDNSGSVSATDKRVFARIMQSLPKEYAEYIFVATGTGCKELTKEEIAAVQNGTSETFPHVGSGDGQHRRQYDASSQKFYGVSPWMGSPAAPMFCVEFEALQEWILEAVRSGRLRAYPKAVLVISDAQSWLCHATLQQASRWLVIYNHDGRTSINYRGVGRDCVTAQGRREVFDYIRVQHGQGKGVENGACKLPPRAFQHLRNFIG